MGRYRAAQFGVIVALLSWWGVGACAPAPETPVRVVLITLDTLRGESLPAQGAGHMPLTEKLAERGLRFENHFSATSTTQPTHASLFTGLHPWQTGVPDNGAILTDDHVTVAELLQEHGFATAAIVASFPLHAKFGFDQGFDTYIDDFTKLMNISEWEGAPVEERRFYSLADDVADRAIALIDAAPGDRQFFWFHFFDAHDPYGDTGKRAMQLPVIIGLAADKDPRLEARLVRAKAAYQRDVEFMDRALGRVYERLEQDAELFETHIVVTSDHGESFGDDGSLGHGRRLTRDQIGVPLVIVSPRVEPAIRTDAVGSVDVATTLLDLAGVDAIGFGGRALTGEDAESMVVGMRRTYATPHPDYRTDGTIVVVGGAWFYAVRDGVLYAGDQTQVVEEDRADRPAPDDVTEELGALFGAFQLELESMDLQESMDEADLEALRHLGYVR